MKTIKQTATLIIAGLLLFPFVGTAVLAQETGATTFLRKVESFNTQNNDTVTFEYIEVPDRASLAALAGRLTNPNNYPLVVLKKDVFGPGVKIVKTLDLQILNYELRDQQWQVLDSIHVEKFKRLEEIAALQEQRVAVFDSANVQLREQITQLNDQLDASVDLTRKTIRARQIKNIWIGALGGAVGFTVGVLISALAN